MRFRYPFLPTGPQGQNSQGNGLPDGPVLSVNTFAHCLEDLVSSTPSSTVPFMVTNSVAQTRDPVLLSPRSVDSTLLLRHSSVVTRGFPSPSLRLHFCLPSPPSQRPSRCPSPTFPVTHPSSWPANHAWHVFSSPSYSLL